MQERTNHTVKQLPDRAGISVRTLHRYGEIALLQDLIHTVDRTILNLIGEIEMSDQQLFSGFSEEDEKRLHEQARAMYGAAEVDASYERWNSYAPEKKETIKAEGQAIYADLAGLIADGHPATSEAVQAVIARWHQHLRHFYEPSIKRLRGLGQLYVDSPDFADKFRHLHPDLPEFMQAAINHYCDNLNSG